MQILSRVLRSLCVAALFYVFSVASAQEDPAWEYLVVSYGTTYFSDPLIDLSESEASRSKILHFSELGITLPREATSLQRNIDVLGRFGWELVAVVGTIGGDQQMVFKRLYDAERSAAEAGRIRSEREELLAAYEATRTTEDPEIGQRAPLVDLDRVERVQATNARNARDAGRVRYMFEQASGWGFLIPELTVDARAFAPDADASVKVELVLDVTEVALVAPGQYRSTDAAQAFEQFRAALVRVGFEETAYSFCGIDTDGRGEVGLSAALGVMHEGEMVHVARESVTLCMTAP